jgi:sortase A
LSRREFDVKRRALHITSVALITASLLVLLDVAVTLAWQEPVSSLYARIQQSQADDEVQELTESFPRATGSEEQIRRRARRLANRFEGELETGNGIGLLEIPAIGQRNALVEGTDLDSLRKGPGHYPKTALPGQGDTVAVAAHRTTYLAPFRDIDDLERGDEVVVQMPYATFTYEVEHHRIVTPDTLGVVRSVESERLVLTACHPLHSAAERYVVFADLSSVEELPA